MSRVFKDIIEYIPQRAPIVMVGKVESYSSNLIVTSLLIEESNLFCSDGFFQECGLIENIAQSAAAMEGCRSDIDGEPIRIGFIGSIKGLKISELLPVGSTITTTVEVVNSVMGVNIVSGRVECGGDIVASATMNIFLQDGK